MLRRLTHQAVRYPLLFAAATLPLSACAAPRAPYRTPDHWSKEGYEWPPGTGYDEMAAKSSYNGSAAPARAKQETPGEGQVHETTQATLVHAPVPRVVPPPPTRAPLHDSRECLRELRQSGVTFRALKSLKGVETPIEVVGKLGGIIFWASDRRPLLLDCRLALALEELKPVFHQLGVTRVRFSGAYSYRRTRSGRLSHHAHGLAIDLHDLEFQSRTFSIEDDFARGVGCQGDIPVVNQLACAMRDQRLFEELLTPDYNFDHRDHLHISVPRRVSFTSEG